MILTYDQINQQCAYAIDNVTRYGIHIDAILQTMYNTGLRIGEVYELDRWEMYDENHYAVNLEKGNGVRLVQISDLPAGYITMLEGYPDTKWLFSVRQVRYLTKVNSPYNNVRAGDKEIVCHLYRYRKAKQLYAAGYTIPQIKSYLCHKSLSVTTSYVMGDITSG